MLDRLGALVARRPAAVVVGWVLVGVLIVVGARLGGRTAPEPRTFLPASAEQGRAQAIMETAFPNLAARSEVAVVALRESGLDSGDFEWLDRLAEAIRRRAAERGDRWIVLSPRSEYLRERLASPDGQAALLLVNLPTFFLNSASGEAVYEIEQLAAKDRPTGLTVELSGTAAAGRDYGMASAGALARTKWVTVTAVLLILLLVYRAPVAAGLPIIAIGACTVVALATLELAGRLGWTVTDLERMFTVVLLYGAGTDFAMFWLARYREGLSDGLDRRAATALATGRVGPAVIASAATTILGLLSLIATQMVPTHNAGRVLGLALVWAPLAGVTLIPALASLLGRWAFWPSHRADGTSWTQRVVWPRIAASVVRRPWVVLAVGLALLLPAAIRAGFVQFRFDALGEFPSGSTSARGRAIAQEHFAAGALMPTRFLIEAPAIHDRPASAQAASDAIATALGDVPGVATVFDLSHPLGWRRHEKRDATGSTPTTSNAAGDGEAGDTNAGSGGGSAPHDDDDNATDPNGGDGARASLLVRLAAAPFYLSREHGVLRVEMLIDAEPFSTEAMRIVEQARDVVTRTAAVHLGSAVEVLPFGVTPYIMEVRHYVESDEKRVWIGATLVIWLVVVLLVRDVPMSIFMIAATLLTYAVALGLSHEFATHVLGTGLDYKVKMFLFVIIVAVGQDYNIFLVSRLRQEAAAHDDGEATRRAIVRTGPVISNCGLIMAATLGSLAAANLDLLRELGFAMAAGILIDTFVVRPLLVPSFWLSMQRWRGRGRRAA